MKVETLFKEVQTYQQLSEIADKTEPHLSFWGSSYITVEGHEGSMPIDTVIKSIYALIKKNYEFTEAERAYGKKITQRISYIHHTFYDIERKANLFTRILYLLRNLSPYPNIVTHWFDYFENETFEYYTRAQFYNVYGYDPEKANKNEVVLIWDSSKIPPRWTFVK